jgi:hypothetical protein
MADTIKQVKPTNTGKVTVLLPRNPGQNANQDEFFSVNFKNYIIKRGERVEIPEELAEVIENAAKAEEYAMMYAEERKPREPK